MANTLVQLNVHIVFRVKISSIRILEDDLPRLFEFMGGIIRRNDGIPMQIGGMPDHIHILCTLPKTMTLSNLVRLIKVGTHKWLRNNNKEYYTHFLWQDGYGAFSVSSSGLEGLTKYIQNQKGHHRDISFVEEYKLFLDHAGIQYDERFAFND